MRHCFSGRHGEIVLVNQAQEKIEVDDRKAAGHRRGNHAARADEGAAPVGEENFGHGIHRIQVAGRRRACVGDGQRARDNGPGTHLGFGENVTWIRGVPKAQNRGVVGILAVMAEEVKRSRGDLLCSRD
jgi:hypothetical protein